MIDIQFQGRDPDTILMRRVSECENSEFLFIIFDAQIFRERISRISPVAI